MKFLGNKKLIAGMLVGIVAIYFIFFNSKTGKVETKYVLAATTKGTIVTTVSGSGQVTVANQINVNPKVSGKITSIKVKNGDTLKAGAVIATLDSKDAQKKVRDANIALQNAKISLEKIQKPADDFDLKQAQSDLEQSKADLKTLQDPPTEYDLLTAQNAITQAERDLAESKDNATKTESDTKQNTQQNYDDAYVAISNAYLDLPQALKDDYTVQYNEEDPNTALRDRTYAYKAILGEYSTFIEAMVEDYDKANDLEKTSFEDFKKNGRQPDEATIIKLLDETVDTAKAISNALDSSRNGLDTITNLDYKTYTIAKTIDELKPLIQSDISTINNHVTKLQTIKNTIQTNSLNAPFDLKKAQTAIVAAEENLSEKQAYLKKLKEGPTESELFTAQQKVQQKQNALDQLKEGADSLDIQTQQLSIQEKVNALADANEALADYTVKAPFDCIVATVNVPVGSEASSGTAIASIITTQLIAQISLNEIDVAKVKVGDKATLTFDALENLSISGSVAEIDTVGTVTQGVVSYNVKIILDTPDERIKPGMSTSAAIITEVKQDVLTVPNAALKTSGEEHYVEMIDNPIPASTSTPSSTTNTAESTVTSPNGTKQQGVEIGIANDTETEIISGLNEGDKIVTRTITDTKTTSAASTSTSALRLGGGGAGAALGGGGFGGAARGR